MIRYFISPANGYKVQIKNMGLKVLFLGPIPFILHQAWAWAIVSGLCALITFGFSNIVFAFMATKAISESYLHNGWEEATDD